MISLSRYPDIPNADTVSEPWLFTTDDRTVRIQALRAALTLARSIFSVAVVSRMGTHFEHEEEQNKRGYLEIYRIRLRWLIRMAWEDRSDHWEEKCLGPEGPPHEINAFYRDEIVWLYNELGVISLAQGSLSDALAYLRQAAEENERIEGRSRNAPNFSHIYLNHAIVQLERGSFKSAAHRLEIVRESNKDGDEKLYHAALGYGCILDYLKGRREGVNQNFKKVTAFFQNIGESRSAAIFLTHHGRFLTMDRRDRAVKMIRRARDIAETDGHEDIRHHTELALLQVRYLGETLELSSTNAIRTVKMVEEYGGRMSIWSLQVEALWLQAKFLLQQGETTMAGRLLIRAMAIAKRNSMGLKLNSAMTTYAETLLYREDFDGAKRIAKESLEMAKGIGYNLETSRAQHILSKLP